MTGNDMPAIPAGAGTRAQRLIAFLRAEGATELGHSGSRSLFEHLAGTYELAIRWRAPEVIAHAALIHSVYGTDAYARPLLPLTRRHELIALAGEQAERLAYLFSVTPRGPLFAGTHRWLRDASGLPAARGPLGPDPPAARGTLAPDPPAARGTLAPDPPAARGTLAPDPPASRDESDALIVLHMANLAEQAQASDGSPGIWLAKLRELAEVVLDSDAVALPLFIAELATFDVAEEKHVRALYRAGLADGDDLEMRRNRLALVAARCAVVPEPCVWLAHLSHGLGDTAGAVWWARCAQQRLRRLGTAWDKRLSFDAWDQLARWLQAPGEASSSSASPTITDPVSLFAARRRQSGETVTRAPLSELASDTRRSRADADGRERFHQYIDTLEWAGDGSSLGTYPDLEAQPWHDPSDFPLAVYLESHFEEIRSELLALDGARFHRESERIDRTGDWDVAFFYERGRRRKEVCDACPVTTRGIETFPAVRSAAGLIYVSRLRPGTHIRPHRGPTNLRLRCHLGITVPDGDCALRVGDETRSWQQGRCLVFDDHLEHEAWNQTAHDRVVLIADLWHPGLSTTEIRLLEGLHGYASAYARRLHRYWAANAAAETS